MTTAFDEITDVTPIIDKNGIYVDAVKGDDSNDGSYEHPLKTIEKAKLRYFFASFLFQNGAGLLMLYML